MSKIDILFIHPSNQKQVYQNLAENKLTAISTPVWTLLLADYYRKEGLDVAIYDTQVEEWDVDRIEKYDPKLIVIMVYGHQPSASTQSMPIAYKIIKDIKDKYKNDYRIALGGNHPSALPQKTYTETNVDFIIQGEGVYTIQRILRGERRLNGTITAAVCPRDPNYTALDNVLNSYAWDLLPDLKNYRAHTMHCFQDFENSNDKENFLDVRSPYVALNTSLGCPYNCSFCMINSVFGKSGIRYWSLDVVMGWIDELVQKYSIRNIRLDDELFLLDTKRVETFCDMLIERDYGLNLWCYIRPNAISDNLLTKLKKAGMNWMCPGIESGNTQVRDEVNKKIKGDIYSVIKSIQDHGINVLGNFMFGLPTDTIETMQQTLDMAIKLNCEFVNFYSTMAYPGSKLYDFEIKNNDGMNLPKEWIGYSQHAYETQPLPTNTLSAREVLEFRDKAFDTYIKNPDYLKNIQKHFGSDVKNYILYMSKMKLKRKLLGD